MATFHVPKHLLIDYVAGATSEGMSLVIATHLAMCGSCKTYTDELEEVGGALLLDTKDAEVSSSALSRVMDKIEAGADLPDQDQTITSRPNFPDSDIVLPNPLRDYLGKSTLRELDSLNWIRLPGYSEYTLSGGRSEGKVRLIRAAAGIRLPRHTHKGLELTLVLKGELHDHRGPCRVGDVCVADKTTEHTPAVSAHGECLCLAANDAPLKFTGPIGKILNPFLS